MPKKLPYLLILPLLSLVGTAAEVAPSPANASKAIKPALTADSTREQVRAALTAQGVSVSDAKVDEVMAQLSASKGATVPAAEKISKQLTLSPDSTREEVKSLLKAQGIEPSDSQVDEVMAQLTALKGGLGAAVISETPVGNPTGGDTHDAKPKAALGAEKKDTRGLHGYLLAEVPGLDLEYRPEVNQYHTEVSVDGKSADFLVDSGAQGSVIGTEFCKRTGIKTTRSGTSLGIAGESANFRAEIASLAIGPQIKFPAGHLTASPMHTSPDPGANADGLLGADILSKIGGILDYRNHRLAYSTAKEKHDIAAKAREAGMREIKMIDAGVYSVIEAKINGKSLRFVVDTGAQQSVLDTATAKTLGLVTIPSVFVVQGVGEGRRSLELTEAGDILLAADVRLRHMPLVVMPLDHLKSKELGHIDGILGADFLHAAGVVFDVANHALYLEPGAVDVRPFSKAGATMFESDAELKKAFAEIPTILAGKVVSIEVGDPTTMKDGSVWNIIEVEFLVDETLKGEKIPAGKSMTVYMLQKDSECGAENLKGVFARNPSKIVFLAAKPGEGEPGEVALNRALWTDGELARAQLKRIQK